MCIGIPGKVKEIDGFKATADVMGTFVDVGIIFVPDVEVGQYVIIHAGQAMTIIDEEYALQSLDEWRALNDELPR